MGIFKLWQGDVYIKKLRLYTNNIKLYLGDKLRYQMPISGATATCSSATYNGSTQIAQNISVVLSGETLTNEVDYSITSNSGGVNAGTYPFTVSGINYFNTSVNGTFTIKPKTVSNPTITLSPSSYTYSGNQCKPTPTVKDGSTTIASSEYTVSYSNNINAGTATCTITDKSGGNYTVSGSKAFTINKVTPTVTPPTAKSLTYNGSAQALVDAGSTNFGTLQYCLNSSGGTYSTSIPSGTNATSYDIWYRVVGDSNVNDVDPAKISVSIAKANPTYTAPTAKSLTYNTSAQELLNAGSTSDGTIQYSSDNISWSTAIPKGTNANTYTSYWKIIGDSNHNDKPSVSISTVISPKTVNNPTITLSPSSYTYNAIACEPTPTVKDGSVTISTSEYTISYTDNTNAGTAKCVISDKTGGNYIVSGNNTFNIAKVTPTVTAPTPKTLTFNNTNQVLANNGSTNWGTIQYCLNNSGGTYSTTVPSASAANVTYKVWYKVVGDSNINDVPPASIDCMIAEKRVTTPTITLDPTGYTYNGSECKPTPTVKDGSIVIPSSEYTTTYSNNVNAGTASVVISDNDAGNYYISGTTTFTIKKAAGSVTTQPTAKSLTYNNTDQALVTAGSGTGTMMYKLGSGSWGTSIPTSKNAGDYTVYYKASASTNYEESASGSVSVNIAKVTPTVTAPTAKSLTYNGSAQALVNAGSTNYGTLKYSTDGSTYSTSIPSGTNATSYTVYYRVDGDSNVNSVAAKTLSVTIAKANPTYSAPTAKSLTYNTSSQALLNAGAVTGGTIYYSSNNTDWSTTIPSQTNAGTYTSYWKITGDSNHNDKASASISTTISPKTVSSPTITLSQSTYTYANTAFQPTPTVKDGSTTIASSEYTVSYSNNTNVGTATCTITDKSGGNYTVSGSKTFTINCYSATAPTAKSLTYNTSAQALANAGSTSYGTMVYCSTSGGTFSTTIPTGTNAGSYEVWWKVTGNTNVCNTAATKVACSIGAKTVNSPTITLSPASYTWSNSDCKPTPTVKDGSTTIASSEYTVSYSNNKAAGTGTCTIIDKSGGNYTVSGSKTFTISKYTPTAPTAKSLTYNTSAQALVNAGSTSYGSIVYSTTSGGTFSTTIPTGTNAGSYEVWWKLSGDTTITTNCNNTGATKISVSIGAKTVSSPTITLSQSTYTYANTAFQPTPTVKDGSTTIASSEYTVSYSNNTNVGTATCTITDKSGGNYTVNGSKTFTITCYSATAPTAKSLTYNTSAQTLANAGSTAYGTMVYCSTSGGTFSTTIPTGTNAGSYEVWWKVTGNTNVCNTAAAKVACSIAAKTVNSPTITLSPSSYVWSNSECKPTPTVKDGSVTIAATEYTVGYSNNKAAGTATCSITDKSGGNYTVSGSKTFTISKYTPNAPTAKSLTYSGSAQALVNAGSTSFGTIVYCLNNSGGTYTTSVPTATNAGSYDVWWKLSGDTTVTSNCNNTAATKVACSIAKAAMTYSAPKAAVRTYNGSAQQIVSGQSAGGGSIQYCSTSGGTYTTTVPTQTNTGTSYSTWWKAVPDSNHSGGTNAAQITGCKINKKALTITAKAQTVNYGTAITQGTGQTTTSGLVSGDALTAITLTQSTTNVPGGTITPSAGATTKGIGNYSVTYNTGTLTINKVAMTYSAPKAAVRTYNGSAQQIVSGQSAGGGSIQYCSTSGGTYTTTVPTQTNTGTSYSTWWKAVPDGNHSGGTNAAQITGCKINKKALTITAKAQTVNYGTAITKGTGQTTTSGLVSGDALTAITLTQSTTNVPGGTITPSAGATTKGISNYSVTYNTGTLTINKVAMSYCTPKVAVRTYNGASQQIVSGTCTTTGGSVYYATSNAGASSSTTIPTATNVGTWTRYWKAIPDSNHSGGTDSWAALSNCKINQKALTITAKAQTITWGGSITQGTGQTTTSGLVDGDSLTAITLTQSTTAVTTTGTITPSAGATTKGIGNYSVTYKTGTLTISKKTGCTISFATTSVSKTYGNAAFTNTITNTGDGSITWGSSNTSIATVNSRGKVTIKAAGSCTISATTTSTTNCTYSTTAASYSLSIAKAAMTSCTPTAKTGLVYNGSAQVLMTDCTPTGGDIQYSGGSNSSYSTTVPKGTNAGSYTINWKNVPDSNHSGGTTGSSTVSIAKAAMTYTAPSAATHTYNGSAQQIVSGGSANGGSIYYATSSAGASSSTTVPTRTNTGSTDTYWKAVPDSNHSGGTSSWAKLTGTINKASLTITAKAQTVNYGTAITKGTGQTTTSGLVSGDALTAITLTQSTTNVPGGTITPSAGATTKGIGNYSVTYKTGTLTINKVAMSYKAPSAATHTYNGSAQQIVSGASATGGSIQYCSTSGGTYTTTVPTQTNAGTSYSTWWKAVPDGNHSGGKSATQITGCKINKANQPAPTATGATVTYHNTATATADGGGKQGTLTWTNGSTRTAVGTQDTYAYWAGNSNYNASPNSNKVTLTVNKATDQSVTVTLTNRTYNGSGQVVASATSHGCTFYLGFGSSSTSAPSSWGSANSSISQTNAGTYYVWYKATADGNHSADIGATYKGTVTIGKANQSAPTATGATTTYNTTATATASGGGGQGSIEWSNGNTQTSVGSKSTQARWTGNSNYNASPWSNSVTVQMNKANGSVTINGVSLTYNGSNQNLATVSGPTGTMHYSTNGTSWSTSIPQGKDVGSWKVYWYMDASTNYNGIGSASTRYVSSSIGKANQSAPTATGATTTYNTTATATASGGGGVGSIEWESAQSQTSVGSHTTRARWTGNSNYNASPWSNSVTVQMNKANGSVAIYGVSLTYNGNNQNLATVSGPTGTMHYSTNGTSWSTSIPQGKDVGSWKIYWYMDASTNYNGIGSASTRYVTSGIVKANQSAPNANGATVWAGSTATAIASGGGGQGSIEWSNGNTRTAVGTQSTQARWSGNGNYNASSWSNSVSLTVKDPYAGHAYVDLGLPSGKKWATMNIGASSQQTAGNYYMYGKGSRTYVSSDSAYTGTENPLSTSVDTARQVWAGLWRTPTKAEWDELYANTTVVWTAVGGINGRKFTSKKNTSLYIFIPACGRYSSGTFSDYNTTGYYYTSTPDGSTKAYRATINSAAQSTGSKTRTDGYNIRAIID